MKKILMVAPSSKTRGGITEVIKIYQDSTLWEEFGMKWIETQYDGNSLSKIGYSITGFFSFLFYLPKSQIIHIHLSEPVSAMRKTIFFLIAKLFAKPVIFHLHSFDSKTSIGGKFKPLYTFLFTKATKVIVLSPYWEQEVLLYTPACNTEILYNPCPTSNKKDVKKDKIILFAGTLNNRKGYSVLINSFALIAKKYPEWKVVFAGNGEIKKGKERVEELGISEQVEFLGWISGNEKKEIFARSMIFCLPSFAEGFPMAILDAFSYGLPVVSTNCGRIDLVLKNNEEILFFQKGNSEELASLLEKLILDETLRAYVGRNGYNFGVKNFDKEVVVEKLKTIYKAI